MPTGDGSRRIATDQVLSWVAGAATIVWMTLTAVYTDASVERLLSVLRFGAGILWVAYFVVAGERRLAARIDAAEARLSSRFGDGYAQGYADAITGRDRTLAAAGGGSRPNLTVVDPSGRRS